MAAGSQTVADLADIVPAVFAPVVLEKSIYTNALLNSGVITQNAAMSAKLAAGSITFQFPSIKALDASNIPANVSTDNPDDIAPTEKLEVSKNIAVRNERNKGWSSADLTATLTGFDPLDLVASMVSQAVNKWRNATLSSILKGVINETNMSGSINTISVETSGYTDANRLSSAVLVDTTAVWGDSTLTGAGIVAVMHSDVYRFLARGNFIDYKAPAEQNFGFGTYAGFTVLVDDSIGKRAGTTSGSVYMIYLIKPGAIEFGVGTPKTPVEVQRFADQGEGGGVEQLWYRDGFAYHIIGSSWKGTPANVLPTDAELATAANWEVLSDPKQLGVAAISVNV